MQGHFLTLEYAVHNRKIKALKRLQLGNCSGLLFPKKEPLSTIEKIIDRAKKFLYTQDEYLNMLLNLNGS